MISIHALLAESDPRCSGAWSTKFQFLSTLSLRRATPPVPYSITDTRKFLSTLSLRRATCHSRLPSIPNACISIHALLAESDAPPCKGPWVCFPFLSTLSLRRATRPCFSRSFLSNFYPRSPCGERRDIDLTEFNRAVFLSTLSLRRATSSRAPPTVDPLISIHALLAESDVLSSSFCALQLHFYPRSPCGERPIFAVRPYDAPIFLSTLSLRRATTAAPLDFIQQSFLSTLSLRRATHPADVACGDWHISIHALLAESDAHSRQSRKPYHRISIHALLAESDKPSIHV